MAKTPFKSLYFGVTINLVSVINSLTKDAYESNNVYCWHTLRLHGLQNNIKQI